MNTSLGTKMVADIMTSVVLSVKEHDKMDSVAQVFKDEDINAAPVVNDAGTCIGVITSHDLAEFEATRAMLENEIQHGYYFNLAHYGDGDSVKAPGQLYDEVCCHMTRTPVTVDAQTPLSRAARTMCQKHIHHLLVLDNEQKPVGILSSLDILAFQLGETVARDTDPSAQQKL